jgi:holo-[acyl-carrier protein] synthase
MIVGIGIDVVDIDRVRRMLQDFGPDRLYARLLSDRERTYCESLRSPAASVAARLAAKEACFKALSGTEDARGIGWKEIEVVHDPFRRPTLVLHGRADERWVRLGCSRSHVSMTHSDLSAVAVVVLERGG